MKGAFFQWWRPYYSRRRSTSTLAVSTESRRLPMQPIFIGGCQRSGTTMLGDRLGNLSGAVVTPESQFKTDAYNFFNQDNVALAFEAIENNFRYKTWDLGAVHLPASVNSYRQLLIFLVMEFSKKTNQGQAIWIDHTPTNTFYWPQLSAIFPDAKFIHIVRDGRAVASSLLSIGWGARTIIDAARQWMMHTSVGLALSLNQPTICITVRFEDLVAGNLAEWQRLLDFINAADPADVNDLLRASGGHWVPLYTKGQHKFVGFELMSDRIDAWRAKLTKRDVEIFESLAGGLLAALDYEINDETINNVGRLERLFYLDWPVELKIRPIKSLTQRFRRLIFSKHF
jgi:hypothetical protein